MAGERPYADEGEMNAQLDAIQTTLVRIETQVRQTNGRVSALEKWRWLVTGALFVLSVIIGWERVVMILVGAE